MSAANADPGEDLGRAVAEWLTAELGVPVDVTSARRLSGGSSRENWSVDAVVGGQERALLLRRDPTASVADTDRAIEVGVLRALAATAVPTPSVVAADLDGTRLGRPAVVMERSPGRTDRAMLRTRDPLGLGEAGRRSVAGTLPALLADVHCVGAGALAPLLGDPPADPAAAEIARWEAEIERVRLEAQPELAFVALWLWEHRPSPAERVALVHGDFRPANVLVDDEGALSVLLDWEFAHIGDPAEDLGWYTSPIYRVEHFIDGEWRPDDFLTAYGAAGGGVPEPDRLRFWQVLAGFKLGTIALAGIHSFVAGTTDRAAAPATALLRRLVTDIAPPGDLPSPAVATLGSDPKVAISAQGGRPTPAETVAGIGRILRTTVAPVLTDPHASAQLHQIVTVLGQLELPEAPPPAADPRLDALLAQCAMWADATGGGAVAAVGGRQMLERFIVDLRAWRQIHGPADSDGLLAAIAAYLRNHLEDS